MCASCWASFLCFSSKPGCMLGGALGVALTAPAGRWPRRRGASPRSAWPGADRPCSGASGCRSGCWDPARRGLLVPLGFPLVVGITGWGKQRLLVPRRSVLLCSRGSAAGVHHAPSTRERRPDAPGGCFSRWMVERLGRFAQPLPDPPGWTDRHPRRRTTSAERAIRCVVNCYRTPSPYFRSARCQRRVGVLAALKRRVKGGMARSSSSRIAVLTAAMSASLCSSICCSMYFL